MNFESVNITEEALRKIYETITYRQSKSVVWLGVHPWLPFIIDLFLELGVFEIFIIDNDEKKQGILFYPYRCPNESFRVKSIKSLTGVSKETVFFMANTHDREFKVQLNEIGVDNKIINLYDDTLYEQKFLSTGLEYVANNNLNLLNGSEIQQRGLKILKDFKKICEERGLRYWLAAGTMLGAVRHGGFIPWDDDIDVEMPYEDYMELVENPPKNDGYYLLNWRLRDDYALTFSKYVDKDTTLLHDRLFPNVYKMGCYIDIFPVGGYPETRQMIEEKWIIDDYRDRCWNYYYATRGFLKKNDIRDVIEREKFSITFDEAGIVGGMHRMAQKRWCVSKQAMEKTVQVKFEDDSFPIPIGYDEYLKERYGNYLKIPEVENQVMHSFYTYENVRVIQ